MIGADQLTPGEDVLGESGFDLVLGGARLKVEHGVERVELKEIAMWFARRRAGAAVADLFKVIRALFGIASDGWRLRCIFGKFRGVGRQIKHDPMRPHTVGRIGIIDDQNKAAGAGRRAGPG